MLFILNKPDAGALKDVHALAGDDDKDLLLYSDGVYLARESSALLLGDWEFDGIYADADALGERGLAAGPHCRPVQMPAIVELVLEHGKIMSL